MNLGEDELAKLTHIDRTNLAGRAIPLVPLWTGEEWRIWHPRSDGILFQPKAKDVGDCNYFGEDAADPGRDIYLPFSDFMVQQASWEHVNWLRAGIEDDIRCLGTSLAKIDVFYEMSKDEDRGIDKFVATEVQFLFGVCRSLLDLLQEVVAGLWRRIELHDPEAQRKKKALKKSFRGMVLEGHPDAPMSAERIRDRYGVPDELAAFYYRTGPFFAALRKHRDALIHGGKAVPYVFCLPHGFAMPRSTSPFAEMGAWRDEHVWRNDLASLRPALAHVVFETIRACNEFVLVISRMIKFPPPIAPGLHLFIRHDHNAALLAAQEVHQGGYAWWGPDQTEHEESEG